MVEHHLEVGRTETSFYVDASDLAPYTIDQGNWYLLPLYLSTSGSLSAPPPWNAGFKLLCFHCLSGNQKPLSIGHFAASTFEKEGRVVVFDKNVLRPMCLNFKTDRILIQVVSLGGDLASLEKNSELLFGLALLQTV